MVPSGPNAIGRLCWHGSHAVGEDMLRMYCIDRAGVPETHDAHAFHCLYD